MNKLLYCFINTRKIKMFLRDPKNEIYGVITVGIVFVISCIAGSLLSNF